MASLAEKRMEDAEDHPIDQNTEVEARPEELRLLEALLFASAEPIDQAALAKRMPDGVDVKFSLGLLQAEYATRGVNLVKVGKKWTFRTAGDLSWLLTKNTVETRKLSRAAMETLAIIAYHQPVTRAEIEDIRGVSTSKGTVDVLLQTGWIRPRLNFGILDFGVLVDGMILGIFHAFFRQACHGWVSFHYSTVISGAGIAACGGRLRK